MLPPNFHWSTRIDYALLVLLALIWSTAFLLIKVGVETIPPITITIGRLALGAIVLGIIATVTGAGLPSTLETWRTAAVVGLLGNAIPFTLIHWGEQTIDSGLAALFMGVMPIWVVVLAHFFADEPITRKRSAGVACAFSGLFVLVGWDVVRQLGQDALAQTAIIAAAICYALATIYVRRQKDLPTRQVAAGSLIVGGIILLPLMLIIESPDFREFSVPSLWAVAVLGVMQTGVAALIYFRLIARLGATIFSQINYIIPVLGVIWGILLLDEQPGIREVIALVCIMGGLVMVNQKT